MNVLELETQPQEVRDFFEQELLTSRPTEVSLAGKIVATIMPQAKTEPTTEPVMDEEALARSRAHYKAIALRAGTMSESKPRWSKEEQLEKLADLENKLACLDEHDEEISEEEEQMWKRIFEGNTGLSFRTPVMES
jgi:hypothetical protein